MPAGWTASTMTTVAWSIVGYLIVMVRNSSRGNVVLGWRFVGLLGLGFVYVIADAVLH
jgi:hypothetical protein